MRSAPNSQCSYAVGTRISCDIEDREKLKTGTHRSTPLPLSSDNVESATDGLRDRSPLEDGSRLIGKSEIRDGPAIDSVMSAMTDATMIERIVGVVVSAKTRLHHSMSNYAYYPSLPEMRSLSF